MSVLIQFSEALKSYGKQPILDGASVQFSTSDKMGLIGGGARNAIADPMVIGRCAVTRAARNGGCGVRHVASGREGESRVSV